MASFSSIPEELRQEITSYLDYDDAWSLKQTSRLFYRVVEIPTIASFFANPYGPSLEILEDWDVTPEGYDPCCYCRRFLRRQHFSRRIRKRNAARHPDLDYVQWREDIAQGLAAQDEVRDFDYTTWDPEEEYCLVCGVSHCKYRWGEPILTGFGEPGSLKECVLPCSSCGILNDPYDHTLGGHPWCCTACREVFDIVQQGKCEPLKQHSYCPENSYSTKEQFPSSHKTLPKKSKRKDRPASSSFSSVTKHFSLNCRNRHQGASTPVQPQPNPADIPLPPRGWRSLPGIQVSVVFDFDDTCETALPNILGKNKTDDAWSHYGLSVICADRERRVPLEEHPLIVNRHLVREGKTPLFWLLRKYAAPLRDFTIWTTKEAHATPQ